MATSGTTVAHTREVFQDGFLRINEVPTHVMTFGCWVKDEVQLRRCGFVVIIFPGNPGMIEFYKDFMETIYERLYRKVPVWGISHAGHVKVPSNVVLPPLNDVEDHYGLHGQIQHKVAFIENYVPSDISVVLVGHSIGCYLALEVMSSIVGSQILKSILLFPTIEQLALSPQGQWASPLLSFFQPIAMLLSYLLSYLSERIQYKVVQWYFQGQNVPECVLCASMNIFIPECTKRWMHMAYDEMKNVREADTNNIARHLDDLIFYYGANDHWCPKNYYLAMKERFPMGKILLCDKGYDHAFVLHSSVPVGELVTDWLQETLKEYFDDDTSIRVNL